VAGTQPLTGFEGPFPIAGKAGSHSKAGFRNQNLHLKQCPAAIVLIAGYDVQWTQPTGKQ
jgi:hypothetical protein